MPKHVNVRVGPRVELTTEEEAAIRRVHADLRRQIVEYDRAGDWAESERRTAPGVVALVARLREGKALVVSELAIVCRAMAWDDQSFYTALGLDVGDYAGLIRLNDNVYFDGDFGSWDT